MSAIPRIRALPRIRNPENSCHNSPDQFPKSARMLGRPHPLSTLGISQQARSTIYLLAGRAHASSDIAGGRPRGSDGAAISGVHSMSDYSRRGREASAPPLVISKYSRESARISSIALLCPPAPPALGREFRFQKAMMALAPAEIPPISGIGSLS